MRNFLRLFDNISIRRKFILVYLFCICVPVVAGAIVWVGFTSSEMQENATHYLDQTFDSVAVDFNYLTQAAVNIANQVSADKSVFNDLSTRFSSPAEHYDLYWNALRNRFNMYLVSNPDIAEITLYIDDPHFINTDYFRVLDYHAKQTDWHLLAKETDAELFVYPDTTAIAVTPYKNRITVVRRIMLPEYLNSAQNYLLIELKLDRLIAKLSAESGSTDSYITDKDNRIIWCSLPGQEALKGTEFTPPSEKKFYILQSTIGPTPYFDGWKLTSVYDKNQLVLRQLTVLAYILLITLALAGFSVFLIWSVLNSMRYRLTALSAHMKDMRGDQLTPLIIENPGRDEVGWLIRSFNLLIGQLNELINVVYKLEMQKKSIELETVRAEYQYLQAQVDPHFLFNTLNAILVFCVKNGYTELTDVIESLSKLLKRLITGSDDLITVPEELDFIDKYLSIEKFRFADRFDYEISVSPEVASSGRRIPKMSIQPIVENACKHGLQASTGRRRLLVKAELLQGDLVITVQDNGSGMPPEKVDAILSRIGEQKAGAEFSENGTGVGIQNVYRRMMMNFGDRFHFSLQSELRRGTKIVLRIEET